MDLFYGAPKGEEAFYGESFFASLLIFSFSCHSSAGDGAVLFERVFVIHT